jgi:hypothetical protein
MVRLSEPRDAEIDAFIPELDRLAADAMADCAGGLPSQGSAAQSRTVCPLRTPSRLTTVSHAPRVALQSFKTSLP